MRCAYCSPAVEAVARSGSGKPAGHAAGDAALNESKKMNQGTNLYEAHKQWASRPSDQRFETLTALRESVHNRRLRSRSTDIDCTRLQVTQAEGLLTVNGTIEPSEPTHWSFGQLSSLVKAPAGYLRTLSPDLVVQNLNYGLQRSGREAVKFMTVENDGSNPNTLQAVTSTTYGRIWDADCVDAVLRIVEKSGGRYFNPKAYVDGATKPSGLYASDHDVFMFLIDGGSYLEAGERAKLHRGFICWNSETCARTFGLMTFLHNGVCGNHIIWGASDINKLIIRHTSGGPTRFDSEAMPTLKAYCEASAAPIESTIRRAQALQIGDKPETVTEWLNKHGKFTKGEIANAITVAKAEEGEARTLWQLVQGFTAYARGYDFIDSRVDLERRAGALLDVVAADSGKASV